MKNKQKNPIIVIGNPRSGTSLLRLMLCSHPNIVIVPESGFALYFFEKYKDLDLSIISNKRNLFNHIINSRKFETWNLDEHEVKENIFDPSASDYREIIKRLYILYGEKIKGSFERWGDKNGFYIEQSNKIKELFPESIFIHIVRDGRDVAVSYKETMSKKITSKYSPKLSTEISKIAIEWAENLSNLQKTFNSMTSEDYFEIKYEDLLNNPEIELKRVCDFIEEEFDTNMLRYYDYNSKYNLEPKEFLQWKDKTLKPVDTTNIGKYKSYLSEEEIGIFNSIASEFLKIYRYAE